MPGIYNTYVVPDMDRSQQIKGVLKIHVEKFNQASYSYPYQLPIPDPIRASPPEVTPPSIISIDSKLVSIMRMITIKGLAFRSDE